MDQRNSLRHRAPQGPLRGHRETEIRRNGLRHRGRAFCIIRMTRLMIKPERLAFTSPGQSEAPPWVGEPNTLGAPEGRNAPGSALPKGPLRGFRALLCEGALLPGASPQVGECQAFSLLCCARVPCYLGLRPRLANARLSACFVVRGRLVTWGFAPGWRMPGFQPARSILYETYTSAELCKILSNR